MKAYMLRDIATGLFYRRNYTVNCWVLQEAATIWSTKRGPAGVMGRLMRRTLRRFEVVTFRLEEIT